jgi:hypothetical protein
MGALAETLPSVQWSRQATPLSLLPVLDEPAARSGGFAGRTPQNVRADAGGRLFVWLVERKNLGAPR